jgi:hypothetical protein
MLFKTIMGNQESVNKYPWNEEESDHRDYFYYFEETENQLPNKVDLSGNLPLIVDNEDISSTAKTIVSVYQYQANKNNLSGVLLHQHCGTSIRKCLKYLRSHGICQKNLKEEDIYKNAFENRIYYFYRIKSNIVNIKAAIYNLMPVIFGYDGVVVAIVGYDDDKKMFTVRNPITQEFISMSYDTVLSDTNKSFWGIIP